MNIQKTILLLVMVLYATAGVIGGQLLNKINSISPKFWIMYNITPT